MANDKKEVNVHIIHSMKGGCGKSTCALSKALQLANQVGINEKQEAKVLFVDVDFRGSALQWLLFGEEARKMAEKKAELLENYEDNIVQGKAFIHRCAVPDNYEMNNNLSQYLQGKISCVRDIIHSTFTYHHNSDFEDCEDGKLYMNGYIDMVFSASDSIEKEAFRHSIENDNYRMPTLTAGIFLYRINSFFEEILRIGKVEDEKIGKYSDIVIDMPPSYDEYSDILLMELKKKAKQYSIKLHYYAVTTDDAGHIHLTIDNIKREVQGNSIFKPFDSVNIIFNSVMKEDFDNLETQQYADKVRKILQGKGCIYKKEHESAYHKFCQDVSCQKFPLSPIKEIIEDKGKYISRE